MIGACAPVGTPSLARDVLAGTDCLISTQIEAAYAALLAPGGTLSSALTIGLTIYVALIGYRLILGQAGLTLGELVPHFVKIGVVVALVTSWPAYQALVFDLLFHGPEQLADPILRQIGGTGTASGGVLTALQDQFDRLTDFAGDAWGQKAVNAASTATTAAPAAAPFPGSGAAAAVAPPAAATSVLPQLAAPQFASIILWASALLMLASTVRLLLVVRIVLALLLVFGPVFVAFALFANTRGLFEGWLRMAVKFALVPLIALPLIAGFVAVIAPYTAALTDEPITDVRTGPVLVIGLIVLVLAAVMLQVTRLTAGIAAGIRLPRGRAAVPAPVTAAAAGEMRVVNPVVRPSRAELLVQTLRGAGGQPRVGVTPTSATATPGATRRITTTADAPPVADSGGRLGQGYRRLAIGSTSARPAGR